MADSNSQPPRCPCGFWGSPQTMGLCSKCFKEHQKKVEHVDQSNPNTEKTPISADSINKALSSVQPMDTSSEVPVKDVSNGTSISIGQSSDEKATDKALPDKQDLGNIKEEEIESTSEPTENVAASTSKDPSPGEKRESPDDDDDNNIDDRPPQKNKKRCFQCNCKLELAIRQIGKCRCDYVFCQLHRLPEQHNCIYDHKGKGRQEARDKMISPKKHIGTSLKRIDSDS